MTILARDIPTKFSYFSDPQVHIPLYSACSWRFSKATLIFPQDLAMVF
jgi:hypothetical protein